MDDCDYDLDTLEQSGPEVLCRDMIRLRRRTQSGGIVASTTQTYFAYISACLSFGF